MNRILSVISLLLLLGLNSYIVGLQIILSTIKLGLGQDQLFVTFLTIESVSLLSTIASIPLLRYVKKSDCKLCFSAISFSLVTFIQVALFVIYLLILPLNAGLLKILLIPLLFLEKTCEALLFNISISLLCFFSNKNSGIFLGTYFYFTLICSFLGFNSLHLLLISIDLLAAYPLIVLGFFVLVMMNYYKIDGNLDLVGDGEKDQQCFIQMSRVTGVMRNFCILLIGGSCSSLNFGALSTYYENISSSVRQRIIFDISVPAIFIIIVPAYLLLRRSFSSKILVFFSLVLLGIANLLLKASIYNKHFGILIVYSYFGITAISFLYFSTTSEIFGNIQSELQVFKSFQSTTHLNSILYLLFGLSKMSYFVWHYIYKSQFEDFFLSIMIGLIIIVTFMYENSRRESLCMGKLLNTVKYLQKRESFQSFSHEIELEPQ